MIDLKGFREGVAMVLVNDRKRVFWGRRIRQNAWQFPQGGILKDETPEQAMYRELYEEVGLKPKDVEIITCTQDWLHYRLPSRMIRHHSKPICVGQKHKWYLLRYTGDDERFQFDLTDYPEFDSFRWVRYWFPLRRVISFKRSVYRQALQEFAKVLFPGRAGFILPDDNVE